MLLFTNDAFAGLEASVSRVGPGTPVPPGTIVNLQITLSNSNGVANLTGVAFSNSLPGTLPNGLKIAGTPTYNCTDPAGPTTTPGVGTLTAVTGTQSISLSGGVIPKKNASNSTDGTCTIILPVTAGSSTGNAATYTYTIANGIVTGNDGSPQSNVGNVSQSISFSALSLPTITKSFASNTLTLGGATTTLTIIVTNPNSIALPNFNISDTFPILGGSPLIGVANTPAATSTCNLGGTAPTFTPNAGDTSISATGGTVAAKSGVTNGTCTITVAVKALQTNGVFQTPNQTNTIDGATNFSNDLGLVPANATANIRTVSPLSITKSFATGNLASGTSSTFSIVFSNNSTSPLTLTAFTDDPIDGIGNASYGLKVENSPAPSITCSGSGSAGTVGIVSGANGNTGVTLTSNTTIAAGGNCTLTATYTGTVQAANTPISFTNTIPQNAVTTSTAGVISRGVSASVLILDELNISKAVSPSNPAPGQPVRYTVTVQNWSTDVLSNVVVTDALTNGQTFLTGTISGINYTPTTSGAGCVTPTTSNNTGDTTVVITIPNLNARTNQTTPGSCSITFYAMTSSSATNGSAVNNALNAGSVCYNSGANCNGGSTSSSSSINSSTLSATKGFSPAGPLSEGTVTTMTITLSNLSANPLTSIAISDTLPLSGSNQLTVATPNNASTTCGGTITAVAGSTSVALNGGTVPGRASNGTGAAGTCLLKVDVVGPAGTYNNQATIAGTQTYANGNTTAIGPVNANATLVYNSSLSATKSFLPTQVTSGGKSTVTINLANSGAIALTGISVTDPLPSGMVLANPVNAYTTCAGGPSFIATPGTSSINMLGANIAGNGNCNMLFDVVATGGANWVNTIPVGNIAAIGGIKNQTAVTGTLQHIASTNINISKATNPSSIIFPGELSQLTITLTNGSQAVTNLNFTDYFTNNGTSGGSATGMQIASTASASTTCPSGIVNATPGATSLSVSGVSLAANASCTVTVNITSISVGGITNIIPSGSISTDQGLSNSTAATTSLATGSNIGVTKKFTPNVIQPGERSRLRITLFNATESSVSNMSLTDNLPSGVTVPSGANPTINCTGGIINTTSGQIIITSANLPAASGGVAASCYAEIDVYAPSQGIYVNTIPSNSASVGGTQTTNSQPATDTLYVFSPVVIHKAIANKTLDTGNPAGFTTGTASALPGVSNVLKISLTNPNASALTMASLTDTLPTGLVVAQTPNASTTCANGLVSAANSATSIILTGATIPASGSCTVSVNVLSNISGTYINTIPSGSLTTFEGASNDLSTSAEILISTPPTVTKQFSPGVIGAGGTSTMTIILGNSNASAATLSAVFTDTLPTAPGNMVVANTPNIQKTCPGTVTATAGSGTVTYANGAQIPVGGCVINVDITASTPGDYNNNIPAGRLQTNFGNNQQPANAGLTISPLGFISGKVFLDNSVTPNGIFQFITDTPLNGINIELHSGTDCTAGTLISSQSTDNAGNYLFDNLTAGTYSVCEPIQPIGTTNSITTAGTIVSSNGSTGTAGTASNPTSTLSQVIGIVLNNNGGGGEVTGSINNNFAEIILSSLSGTVFIDQNDNGLQDQAGDIGIAGVSIQLLDNIGAVVSTQTTNAQGKYNFLNLMPETYSIKEPTQPSGTGNGFTTAGSVANGGTAGTVTNVTTVPSQISNIILPPNTISNGNNFAEIPYGRTISGIVFLDYNNDGILNNNDYGIGGVALNLTGTDINGNTVTPASINTNSNGTYSFTDLPAGTYTIVEPSQPNSTTNGITTAGSTGGTASNPTFTSSQISSINLTGSNTFSAGNNFAEVPSPAPDLTISKTHTPPSFGQGSSTGVFTITPNNIGALATDGSTITIVDTLPTGMTLASTATGVGWNCPALVGASSITCTSTNVINAGTSGNIITLAVTVGNGLAGQLLTNHVTIAGGGEPAAFTNNNSADDTVAISTNANVSGTVWLDKNVDGKIDAGEPLLSGWTVELLLNNLIVESAVTGVNGTYSLINISPGSGYQIRFRGPNGTLYGNAVTNELALSATNGVRDTGALTANTGTNTGNPAGATITGGILQNLTLLGGDNIIGQSLPLAPSSLSGTVFFDQDNNGLKDGTDTGIAGVSINLLNSVGGIVSTLNTDLNGNYSFTNLVAGTYSIQEPTQPTNTLNGITTAGSVGNGGTAGTVTNSATVPSQISNIILPPNTTSTGNNFAEIPDGLIISGTVFVDHNNDGLISSNDYGLAGVTLNLTGVDVKGDPVNATINTSSNGTYNFTGLAGGTYSIFEPSQPANTANGIATAGISGGTASNPTTTSSQIINITLTGITTIATGYNFAEIPNAPDLIISKSHTQASFSQGSSTGVFTITPSNIGGQASSGLITIVDTLPAGMTVASPAIGSGWDCTGLVGASSVSCTSTNVINTNATGNAIKLRVNITDGIAGQFLTNTVTIAGGGEPLPFSLNNSADDIVNISITANVSGTVWVDYNHNGKVDSGEPLLNDWTVELLLNNLLVETAVTGSNGKYLFTGVSPGSGYQIRFRNPTGLIYGKAVTNEQGITTTNGLRDSGSNTPNNGNNNGNPAGASITGDGTLQNLTIVAGDNIIQQSLPLDPAGVVYDAITRKPVPGAVVTISGPPGFNPATGLVSGTPTVTTDINGFYQFLLLAAAPAGQYTLTITTYPTGYIPLPSTIIAACNNTLVVTPLPDPAAIQTNNTAPILASPVHAANACPATSGGLTIANQASTQYYFSFIIDPLTSGDVINNHIPLDPILAGALAITKTSPLVNVNVGQLVPYTITVRNTVNASFTNISINDILPPGFKYKVGSASLNGITLTPTVSGRNLIWSNQNFAANATNTYKLLLVVGAGVQPGEYTNTVQAFIHPANLPVSNLASATVRVIPDPLFDCSEIIGKVFNDKNTNGYQDEGEPGIANVRIATVNGLLVDTDADGRFHVACAMIPDFDRGSNFLMKLDERSLPSGFRVTTENPRDIRLTRGKMTKLNFGAAIHKVIRIDVQADAFEKDSTALKSGWEKQIDTLPEKLKSSPSIVRISYAVGKEDESLARNRLKSVAKLLKSAWEDKSCCHALIIEEELVLPPDSNSKKGSQ